MCLCPLAEQEDFFMGKEVVAVTADPGGCRRLGLNGSGSDQIHGDHRVRD